MSGLTAAGQVYLPAVNITSITVSGTTATVVTSAAHSATAGGKVRLKNTGVAGSTGTFTVAALDGTTPTTKFTFTVASGTASSGAAGTVEPLGSAIVMAAKGDGTGFTGNWTAPAGNGASRRIEITVTDSGGLSAVIVHTVQTTTASNPPLVAVMPPGIVTPTTARPLGVVIVDPNAGDTIASTTWAIKDAGGTLKASGSLSAQAPAVSTTLATAIADVTNLTGDDPVDLISAAGASSTGGYLAAIHGTSSIVVIRYGGVSGNSLTNCKLIAGSGALSVGDIVRSANYTATYDASALTPGASYTAQATATDNHGAPGASGVVAFTINTPPAVTWNFPAAAQSIHGTVTLQVTASDDGGITNCTGSLYNMDGGGAGVLVGAFAIAPDGTLTYPFDTTTLTDKADHTFRASVVDGNGAVTTADVTFHVDQSADRTGPTITGIIPAAGAPVRGALVTVGANITDASGVASATFKIDDGAVIAGALTVDVDPAWLAGIDSTALPDGAHTITVTATDLFGNATTHVAVAFTVDNGPIGSSDWFLPTNPMQQTHDVIAALTAAGRPDALVWATAVGVPIRPANSGRKNSVVDSQGHILGVGFAPGDSVPSGAIATSHRAITPTEAATRLTAHRGRWISKEFYDLAALDYRTGPWISSALADEVAGWASAWAAGADVKFMGILAHGGSAGRWSGGSK